METKSKIDTSAPRDFIGTPLKAGQFVAYPGAGNTKAEYGQILYMITAIEGTKVKATRLHCSWRQAGGHPKSWEKNRCLEQGNILIHRMDSTIAQTNKLAVLNPDIKVKEMFVKILSKDQSLLKEINLEDIGFWIHGGNSNPFHVGFRPSPNI